MNSRVPPNDKRPQRRTNPPSAILEDIPRVQGLHRRQTAVIRDLIRLDLATPRFETEGLALVRTLLEED